MEGQANKKQDNKNIAYLIEEIWMDGIENHPSNQLGYEPFAVTSSEQLAKDFCAKGRVYTNEDSWVITHDMPEYRYKPIKNID